MKFANNILLLVLLSGCTVSHLSHSNQEIQVSSVEVPLKDHTMQAVLWQQLSAEYKALCFQAFNLARLRLDEKLLQENNNKKPYAVVVDIDETVLDNSPYDAKLIEINEVYSKKNWYPWGRMESAIPIPGSLEFLQYAHAKGIQIYYISNRSIEQEKETISNLKKAGFPTADKEHVFLKFEKGGKEKRRQVVMKTNEIILLMGDNLADFDELFDDKSTVERNIVVKSLEKKFGKEFIVLPNPVYGDWEKFGIFEGTYKWSSFQQDSLRRSKLITY